MGIELPGSHKKKYWTHFMGEGEKGPAGRGAVLAGRGWETELRGGDNRAGWRRWGADRKQGWSVGGRGKLGRMGLAAGYWGGWSWLRELRKRGDLAAGSRAGGGCSGAARGRSRAGAGQWRRLGGEVGENQPTGQLGVGRGLEQERPGLCRSQGAPVPRKSVRLRLHHALDQCAGAQTGLPLLLTRNQSSQR